MWQVFLMYALFGSIFSVGKIGIEAAPPYFLTAVRMLLAGFLMLIYIIFFTHQKFQIKKQDWVLFLFVAFFNVFITNAFEFWGLQYMSAGKTCLIYSLSPFAAAFIAYCIGSETFSYKKLLGLIIGFVSFCPLMLAPWLNNQIESHPMELIAEGALLISAITSVIGWTFVKKLVGERNYSPSMVNCVSFLIAGVMSLSTSFSIEVWDPIPVLIWSDFLYSLFYIVIIHNIICYSIYASVLKKFSVTFMAFAGLSNPLFAAFFGWLFLNEEMTSLFWLALSGITTGLYFLYRDEQQLKQALVENEC